MYYLLYASHKSENFAANEVDNILASCEKNNPEDGLTGVLLLTDRYFLQYVEGPKKYVLSRFEIIKEDKRHHTVIMLKKGEIDSRYFPTFNMAFKNVETNALEGISGFDTDELQSLEEMLSGKQPSSDRTLKTLFRFYNILK